MDKTERRLVLTWGALMGLTLLSWEMVAGAGWLADWMNGRVGHVAVILGLAFVKVRIVVLDLMDVRKAPILLRAVLEVWIVVVCAAMVVLYLNGPAA